MYNIYTTALHTKIHKNYNYVCNLIGVYSELLYSRIKHSGLCDWNVWSSWRVVRRAPEWAELSPDVCPSVGYESCPPPEAPEILLGRRSKLCYLTSNSPSDSVKCLSLRPLRDALPPPSPSDSLSLSFFERSRGQMSVPTAAAAKYGPSWHKPKVNKIGSKCINFTDKPFTTSVVGWMKSQFRPEETTCSSSE